MQTDRIRHIAGVSALALAASGAPALADVTPSEVWDGFRSYLETSGYEVTANVSESGDALTAAGLVARMDMSDSDGSLVWEGGDVTFADQGDGTVLITFPETMPITVSFTEEGQETVLSLDYTHTDMSLVASGDDSEMTYTVDAPELGIVLREVSVDGEALPDDQASGQVAFTAMSGGFDLVYSDPMTFDQDIRAEEMSIDFNFTDPETGDTGSYSNALTGVAMTGSGAVPELDDQMMADEMIEAGLDVTGEIAFESGQSQLSGTSDGAPFEMASSSGGGSLTVSMSGAGLAYGVAAQELQFDISSPDVPFPISASAASTETSLLMPVTASEEPQDFEALIRLDGLEVSEMLWSMFDPQGNLPRDPATLVIDLSGQATPTASFFDPEAMEASGEAPAEINAVTIDELRLSAAGAELAGDGAFTFDNENTEAFGGMPAPSGEATLNLTGANALIDSLISMGILSNEDAMGARMMMSMFTVPGDGEDNLSSTIRVTEDGQVLANGQRIR